MTKLLNLIIPFSICLFFIISPVLAADRECVNNVTLRQYFIYSLAGVNTTGSQDVFCNYGCDYTTSQCKGNNYLNIYVLGILVVVAGYLMFGRKDAILNIMGALFIALVGSYMIVTGVNLGWSNSQYDTFLVKDYFTNALGILFICVAIYKIAMAWIHMKDASA